MATYKNAYDKLYDNMKNAFTVVNDGAETTLGEYMLRHAKAKNGSNLPIAAYSKDNAIEAIYSYVNSKLTIKTPPVKDKTIRAFPIRSCAGTSGTYTAQSLILSGEECLILVCCDRAASCSLTLLDETR